MDDVIARACLSAIFEPDSIQLQKYRADYQLFEIVQDLQRKGTLSREDLRNITKQVEQSLNQFSWLTPGAPLWPEQVTRLGLSAPLGLWAKGNLSLLHNPFVAMVGSRECSSYGRTVAEKFAKRISAATITVASGGAIGIDTACHKGAIREAGSTIAVLAGGFNHLYPKSNIPLFKHIEEQGLLISEVSPWQVARPHWFLSRNRIIAALSETLVVIESRVKSGAMSSVSHANALGIEVCAVPGAVTSPYSSGPHALIRDGARLVDTAQDVLCVVWNALKLQYSEAQSAREQFLQSHSQ
ncbi:MAG: protecting protein DprA [Actinomycetota bacterium]|jgi:DNA processing protein